MKNKRQLVWVAKDAEFEVPKDELMFVISKTEPDLKSRLIKLIRRARGDDVAESSKPLLKK